MIHNDCEWSRHVSLQSRGNVCPRDMTVEQPAAIWKDAISSPHTQQLPVPVLSNALTEVADEKFIIGRSRQILKATK